MLKLELLKLVQFRNYTEAQFAFRERVIGICGANGTGKTNLLDAIYYLSLTRSYFSRPDSQSVTHGAYGWRIEGHFTLDDETRQAVCILRENNRKEFSLDGELYRKFSEHIGKFPCVMIAPDDVELVSGGGEPRRNFLDAILCQLDKDYLAQLIAYNKILQQRNSFLKQVSDTGSTDEALLEILNEQLSKAGQFIYEKRKHFIGDFLPLAMQHYERIAEKNDSLGLKYHSQLHHAPMKPLLGASLQKDLALQRTTVGIHRDDVEILMNGLAFRAQASQGQRKSLLFALKLAEWDALRQQKGFTPILLLDDAFEKLDAQRMHNLLHWVCTENEGQVFITDTHGERLTRQLEDIGVKFDLVQLS